MCDFGRGGLSDGSSPDRLDALTELVLNRHTLSLGEEKITYMVDTSSEVSLDRVPLTHLTRNIRK
jgi:hypothetical protein